MFINLCPHTIHLPNGLSLPPSGEVARCTERDMLAGNVEGVPIITRQYSNVTGLPAPQPNVWLIVSSMVRTAMPKRTDLLSPGTLARDADGNITGCLNLIITDPAA